MKNPIIINTTNNINNNPPYIVKSVFVKSAYKVNATTNPFIKNRIIFFVNRNNKILLLILLPLRLFMGYSAKKIKFDDILLNINNINNY